MRNTHLPRQRLATSLGSLLMSLFAGFSATSMAGTLDLSPGPPAATTTVAPNLVLTFDDSGSMNWHHMPDQRPYDGKGWGTQSDTNQSDLANRTYRNQAAPFLCAGVITPGIADPDDARSWSMNGIYYNPDNTYDPPMLKDGKTAMPNATYTSAWDNGIVANRPSSPSGGSNKRDLSGYHFCGNTGGGYYQYNRASSTLPISNGQLTSGAIAALYANRSVDWSWVSLETATAAEKTNFANWFAYYRTRTMASVTAISRAYAPFGENVRVAWQNINATNNLLSNSTGIYKFIDGTATNNVRTGFYNWLFAMPATGGTPNRTAAIRVGKYFTNRTGSVDSNPYFDQDVKKELVCRQNFHIQMTDGMWNGDTPSQPAQHDGISSLAMPDGIQTFSKSDPESKVVWNETSNSIATMADIAFQYWATDLQAGVTGSSLFAAKANRRMVSSFIPDQSTTLFNKPLVAGADPRSNKEIYWNPVNDTATWPHLVQYMIGFGASGNLANNDSTYQGLRKGSTAWPVPSVGTDDGRKIDDMWHAALNSRGKFFAASSPAALVNAISGIINSVVSRNTTSVAGSLSSAVLAANAASYQAGYDTNDWSGALTANAVNADGTINTAPLWNGRSLLDTRAAAGDSRVILTSTAVGSGRGSAFTGAAVVNAINAVDSNFGTATSTPSGIDRLAWLRGDRSKDGTVFRQRNSVFGAVISAQVLYVAQPSSGYSNSWPVGSNEATGASSGKNYEQFRSDHIKRAPTIYVAANDGMLHAFDATTSATDPTTVDVAPAPGRERWAYAPYSAYGQLASWSSLTNFNFKPSVDGTPVTRDVYFGTGSNQGWHTILVAGLRLGGRGVYALDITEAASTEGSTSGKVIGPVDRVLWEFNNTTTAGSAGDPSHLGYTYGRPNIGRLATGQWVVLVPGGYFPAGSTDPSASLTYSSLFVLDAQTGALLKEIKTPTTASGIAGTVTSYGLSTPVLGDYDSNQIDDVAFAGDLPGNVWRFDFSGAVTDWKAELFYRPQNPGDQPVTVTPRLFPDTTNGGLAVVFGTGKYLGGSDNTIDSNTKVQSVYGIRDSAAAGQTPVVGGSTTTPLVQQQLTELSGVRGLTNNPVPAKNGSGVVIRGWYFDLDISSAKGERLVVDATAIFNTNQAVITTLIPQNNDPCDPQPRGALIVVDAATGTANFGLSYNISGWPSGYTQAGIRVKNPPTSGFLPVASSVGGGTAYVPGLKGDTGNSVIDDKVPSFGIPVWRRRSWRELTGD
jgi:type IV pilus assembly protein PilY1